MSVIYNTQSPESTLKKKCNSIAYHSCRESVAMGESGMCQQIAMLRVLPQKYCMIRNVEIWLVVSRLLFNIYDYVE